MSRLSDDSVTRASEAGEACPHLGLDTDPFQHHDEPTPQHRCFLWMQRDRIDLAHQASFCLNGAYKACPWLSISAPLPARLTSRGIRLRRTAGSYLRPVSRLLRSGLAALWPVLLAGLLAIARIVARLAIAAWLWLRPASLRLARFVWRYAVRSLHALLRLAGRMLRSALKGVAGTATRRRRLAPAHVADPGAATIQPLEAGNGSSREHLTATAAVGTAVEPGATGEAAPDTAQAAELVQQGIVALREGGREVAYALFVQATELPVVVEEAWLWRGALAASTDEKRSCLMEVLRLNPDSLRAKAALEQLGSVASRSAAASAPASAPIPSTSPRGDAASDRDVEAARPSVRVMPVTWQCSVCLNSNPSPSQVCRTCGSPSPEVEEQLMASGDVLLEQGLAALKAGNEDLAHSYFAMACEASPENDLAWYWCAKTAEDVEEVVHCLEQMLVINPHNLKARTDLAWARQRQERERAATGQPASEKRPPAAPKPAARLWAVVTMLMPQVAGIAAFLLCLYWLSPAVLPKVATLLALPYVQHYAPIMVVPSLQITTTWADLSRVDVAAAVPYATAILFFYAAYLLDDRRRRARFWGLAVGLLGVVLGILYVTNFGAVVLAVVLCAVMILAVLVGWREFCEDQSVTTPDRWSRTGGLGVSR